MSAYAALVSLRQTLRNTLNEEGLRVVGIRGELQALHEKVIFLVGFLENSFSYKASRVHMSALEAMMRDAAYKAEELIEIPTSGTRDSAAMTTFGKFLYPIVVSMVSMRLGQAILMLGVIAGCLSAVAICTICAVFLHLALNDFMLHNTRDLRGVLNDFSDIEKQVVQNEEASILAAVISLRQILDSALDSSRDRAQLDSIHKKVTFLLDFLGDASIYMSSQKYNLQILNRDIKVLERSAKHLIESQTPAQCSQSSDSINLFVSMRVSLYFALSYLPSLVVLTTVMLFFMGYPDSPQLISVCTKLLLDWLIALVIGFGALLLGVSVAQAAVYHLATAARVNPEVRDNHELGRILYRFNNIARDAMKIKSALGNPSNLPPAAACRNVVVGLDNDLEEILAYLYQNSSQLEVVSIVGMGGIGKTTLASEVYHHPAVVHHFDIRAWVTVSPKYSLHHILLCLLHSAAPQTSEMRDDELETSLHKNLFGRRYLIVMDDVWDTDIWDFIKRCFPDRDNGSRVLMTSQLSNVASYPGLNSRIHQMRRLNENDSWSLLREKVFGAGTCPSKLESIGKEIARNCGGLPLAILVIGGLLDKDNQNNLWRDVADNMNSKLRQADQYLEILGLSYSHLPHHLRPCFLYMGVFPGDSVISVSRLLRLWAAEGFLTPVKSKSLEEVAEEYLQELIDRNLVSVCKRSCNGKIRTCSIHDILRVVSLKIAREENFFHIVHSGEDLTQDSHVQPPCRLRIDPDALQLELKSFKDVRSFLCIGEPIKNDSSAVYFGFGRLRVLDVLEVHFGEFPHQVTKLLLLRYLALNFDGPLSLSISKLQKLQTLVHHHSSFPYPLIHWVIWIMPNLRHVYVKPGCFLFHPGRISVGNALEQLQTLVGIRNFRWSEGIIKRIPNLKKLGISYDVSSAVNWAAYQLESLVDLIQLESLKIVIEYSDKGSGIPPKLAFPPMLKKLSLSGCGIPWSSMAAIGALPNLEALKLRRRACSGSTWKTVRGGFPQLIFLLLEDIRLRSWETKANHFPLLQRLVIRSCGMLEKIPSAVGDIPTLDIMELVDCHSSAVESAIEIQEEQKSVGNDWLKVSISPVADPTRV